MAINRFDKEFRVRNDVFGSITPYTVVQREIAAPQGPWKPADWLPVAFTKSDRDQGTDAFVISSGKVVAMDTAGTLVPAGMRIALKSGITYTATDYTHKVIDLTTGLEYATDGTTAYTAAQVAAAIIERGLVLADAAVAWGATLPPSAAGHYNAIVNAFISYPIGVASDDMYVDAGNVLDGTQRFNNYEKQHLVQFLTEVQLRMPMRCSSHQTSDQFATHTLDAAGSTVYAAGNFPATSEYWDAANIAQVVRYENIVTSASPVVALGLDPSTGAATATFRIASNTTRTPFTCGTTGVLTSEKTSADRIASAGDWYLDADVGVLFVHEDTWDTAVAGSTTWTFDYYYYTITTTSGDEQLHLEGDAVPGDYVTYDVASNFKVIAPTTALGGTDILDILDIAILGRVHRIEDHPKGIFKYVKTAFALSNMPAAGQMPGSATDGYPDNITLSPETVADKLAIVTVRI